MVPGRPNNVPDDQVTDESVYVNRRTFMRAGIVAATTVTTGLAYHYLTREQRFGAGAAGLKSIALATQPTTASDAASGFRADEPVTSFQDITNYNNFYEFSTDKESTADAARGFLPGAWKVAVEGLCRKPTVFDLDDLLKIAPAEERIYRMRCVEAWSMVIPWAGFSLGKLIERVEPLSDAKYVAFTTLLDPKRMPNQNHGVLDWPYVEGLRMDEAMHPLTILASGLYGKELLPQDGAPIRLVVPWKYGFKGIKSIVKIALVADQPPTTWSLANPPAYGFYANVNPEVDRPWSQATERRIGAGTRPTLMFNGYTEQVGHLYAGMDLAANY
jgi:methionine sulfoxide reductase catalytic subunit